MELFNKIQALSNYADKRKAIKELSDVDKIAYKRFQANLRQKKFMSNPDTRNKVYTDKKIYKKYIRASNPDKAKEIVRGYVQRFRERLKLKKEANLIVSNILTDIIDNSFIISDKNKKTHIRQYRANKKNNM